MRNHFNNNFNFNLENAIFKGDKQVKDGLLRIYNIYNDQLNNLNANENVVDKDFNLINTNLRNNLDLYLQQGIHCDKHIKFFLELYNDLTGANISHDYLTESLIDEIYFKIINSN